MDPASEAKLGEVHPALADKIHQMETMLAQENIVFRVTQGLRTWAQQSQLFAQGRTAPGPVVTNAAPGRSWHNFGMAVDLVPVEGTALDWNANHPVWKRMVDVGVSVGLTAGAEFRSFPDFPHFQLTGKWPVSPDDEVRQAFEGGGIQEVWKESGL